MRYNYFDNGLRLPAVPKRAVWVNRQPAGQHATFKESGKARARKQEQEWANRTRRAA